jgi:F-type H+-transporting ATPase subunit c
MGLLNFLQNLAIFATAGTEGLIAIGAGLAVCMGTFTSIGESLIACHSIDGMVRNPEMAKNLRSTMMLGIALDESTAIYAFVIAILILFVL